MLIQSDCRPATRLPGRIASRWLALLLLCSPVALHAAPAIECHCFQERSFDVANPAAADPFFLAATQNSLFAAVAGIEKRKVVKAKMTGALAEELWVRWYVASVAQVEVAAVAQLRDAGHPWPAVVARLHLPTARLAKPFAQHLQQGETALLAAAVVDETLAGYLGGNPAEIRRLRKDGADDRMTIMAVFLSRKGGRAAPDYLAAFRGGLSWGAQLQELGINEENLDAELHRVVRRPLRHD